MIQHKITTAPIHPPTNTALTLIAITLSALLSGCGSGDGIGTEAPGTGTGMGTGTPSSTAYAYDQGRWIAAPPTGATTPAYTAYIQHNANAASSLWLLANDASNLIRLNLSGTEPGGSSGSATGKQFNLGAASSSTITGSFTASGKTLTLNQVLPAPAGALNLQTSDTLATPLTLAQASGAWHANAGSLTVNWTLNATGAITGTSTTGCTWSGQLSAPATLGIYNTTFSETCTGTSRAFAGIATLNPTQTQLTVVGTTAGDAQGAALFFAK